MVNRQNIQVLLDEIVLENVKTYMSNSGWGFSEPDEQEVCIFTREHDEGEQRLWLWKSTSHPKFRSRVQNIIFSLAVQSKREPIEIANEIYDSVAAESKPESQKPKADAPDQRVSTEVQVEIVNSQDSDVYVKNPANWSGEFKLEPGQGLCLRIDKPEGRPSVEFGNRSIRITSSVANSFRTFSQRPSGKPEMKLGAAPDWKEFLLMAKSDQSMDNCSDHWERAAFDLSDLPTQPGFEKSVLKSVAVLLVSIAQEDDSEGAEIANKLWELCKQILSPFGLQLEVFPDCAQELTQTAKFDRPAFPSNTLDWLGIHTVLSL